jgi:DNA-3-methyladenine glycosylase
MPAPRRGKTRALTLQVAARAGLTPDFYERPVVEVARDLIGCTVEHEGAAGVIVETEAYHESEPACHAFIGLTPRTGTLFGPPGRAYVYRSYGIHAMLNAVCEREGVAAAVLIRALEPLSGIELMYARRGLPRSARLEELCSGPGKLTQALGLSLAENGSCLSSGPVRIGPRPAGWEHPVVLEGPRIGISRAVELRWRFCAAGSRNVSLPRPSAAGRGSAAGGGRGG